MKSGLFILLALLAVPALANSSNTEILGCEELETIYGYVDADQSLSPSIRQETNKNIEQAFRSLCKASLNKGDVVIYPNGQIATEDYNTEGSDVFYPNGEVMVRGLGGEEPVWFYPDGRLASETPDELWNILNGVPRKAAKIEAPFKAQHKACASACTYVSWGIWGDLAHQKRKSCHNSGEAIDIHAITCGKTKHSGGKSAKFNAYVKCMKNKFKVLWQVKDHFQHAHIQFHNCKKIKLK